MIYGRFNVVTDGQWGSCGKGLITSFLAYKTKPDVISTTNMANAGHTAVNVDGTAFIAKALPSAAILTKWIPQYKPTIIVGPSAAFKLDQLLKEATECECQNNLIIHQRAGVITEDHTNREIGSGDSTKHIASTMQGCGTFLSDKILRKPTVKLARDYPELANFTNIKSLTSGALGDYIETLPMALNHLLSTRLATALHEGSQGFSLDINHGSHYPQCTSRGTTAINNIADMGISLKNVGDIYLVIRPYPIRVGNVVENNSVVGHSGGHYDDQEEITWEQVAKNSGMPQDEADKLFKKELTTVTKRLRRVFTFSKKQLKEAAVINGATKIALNFANYIDWNCSGVNEHNKLPPKVNDFIKMVEDVTALPVTLVGTGPRIDQVCQF